MLPKVVLSLVLLAASVAGNDAEYELRDADDDFYNIHSISTDTETDLLSPLQDQVEDVIRSDPQPGNDAEYELRDADEDFHNSPANDLGPVTLIVGGNNSSPGQFPYQASLRYRFNPNTNVYSHLCGGALIGKNTVLTAAHCVTGRFEFDPERMIVVLGDYILSRNDDTEQTFKISRADPHPKYNDSTYQNDLAILKLDGTVSYTEAVKPIKLAEPGQNFVGSSCFLSGWGYTRGGGTVTDILQYAISTGISNQECRKTFRYVFDGILCFLSDNKRRGSCNYDSGGPAVCNGVLAGITSFGAQGCLTTIPSAYTRISYYYDFIRQRI